MADSRWARSFSAAGMGANASLLKLAVHHLWNHGAGVSESSGASGRLLTMRSATKNAHAAIAKVERVSSTFSAVLNISVNAANTNAAAALRPVPIKKSLIQGPRCSQPGRLWGLRFSFPHPTHFQPQRKTLRQRDSCGARWQRKANLRQNSGPLPGKLSQPPRGKYRVDGTPGAAGGSWREGRPRTASARGLGSTR